MNFSVVVLFMSLGVLVNVQGWTTGPLLGTPKGVWAVSQRLSCSSEEGWVGAAQKGSGSYSSAEDGGGVKYAAIRPAVPINPRKRDSFVAFAKANWLIFGEIVVIALAKTWPSFGATGGPLRPEIFISKLAVFIIFFINGIALSISGSPQELRNSFKTNLMIQLFSFGFLPLLAKFAAPFYPDMAFRDGLMLLSVLPCTINICVAQTLSAGGNMGTAIFNAIFGNVLGVFLCPILTIAILGRSGGVSLLATLKKLGSIVILPLILGQICRRTPLGRLSEKYSKQTRTFSTSLLLAIVYNIFSDTFLVGLGVSGPVLQRLVGMMPVLYLGLCLFFWQMSRALLPGLDAPTRSAAVLIAPSKTLAFGIPFIKAAMSGRPDLAFVLAPLLLYAPTQLLLGSSILVPILRKKISDSQSVSQGGGI